MNQRRSPRIPFAIIALLRRQPLLRGFSLLLALCCFWSFAGAGAAMSAAPDRSHAAVKPPHSRFPHVPLFQVPVLSFNASSSNPSTRRMFGAPAPVFWTGQRGTTDKPIAQASLTRLDEVGRPLRPISERQARAWKLELASNQKTATKHSPARAALLHVWLGEWQLGQNKQPETAQRHFRQAERLVPHFDRVYGLAAYDSAISLFYEGAFQDAAQSFSALLPVRSNPKTALRGYDRRACSLWLRHAAACAGYHEEHSKLGIPEPRSLDPLCGIASLAECLRALRLPSDKPTLQRACRVSGEGSTLSDLVTAGPKLGVSVRVVSADEQGLKRLPKPLVAFVEHDHFVALVRADNAGVSYLCSDCGAWPGGRVDLTWKQWRAVNPGIYAAVARPGSTNDRLLAALTASGTLTPSSSMFSLQVSARDGLRGLHITERLHQSSAFTALRGHVVRFGGSYWYGCGYGLFCLACFLQDIGLDSGPASKEQPNAVFGPKAGDPVNLVTGEEEYNPPADLTVYNPHGPSIQWGRSYRSLRSSSSANYEADDFGQGWTQPYNVQINDPGSAQTLPQLQQGVATSLSANGTDAPASGLSWDVLLNGTTIASSANANGWTEMFDPNYGAATLTPPSSAQVSTGYEVRFFNTRNQINQSTAFDVVPAASVAQGKSATFAPNGTTPPAAGLQWDIVQGNVTVASSSVPNGWAVSTSSSNTGAGSGITVTAPQFAPVGSFTVRGTSYVYPTGSIPVSAVFSVYGVHYVAVSGTKTLIMQNGAAVAFVAPGVPTASQPHISCSVQPGTPMLVDWYYTPNAFGGYFVVTMADRTKWIMTSFTGPYGGSGNRSFLSQVVDRNGNAINMVYGGLDSVNIPLLSAISDNAGNVLLTIGRGGYNSSITSVSDAYSRSVFYQNPGNGVTQVSQIVPTRTAASNAPTRYVYSYIGLSNPERETVSSALHTIAVPSPTGTGTSTATINYAAGQCNVSNIVDGNGNTRTYTSVNSDGSTSGYASYAGGTNYTRVTVTNPQGATAYSYMIGFDSNMNETSRTDGRTNGTGLYTSYVSQKVYSDPNNPYRPSAVYNGNGTTGVPSGSGPFVPQARSAAVSSTGQNYVTDATWVIQLNGNIVATGEQPNGWTLTYSSNASTFTIGAPASATAGSGYQAEMNTVYPGSTNGYGPTGTFSVLTTGTQPPTQYRWDTYGNMTSETSPRGTVTTKTWDYSKFALGELVQVQVGNKSPTMFSYNEPSGLVSSFSVPLPGTTGSASTATYSYTYDNLGNLLTETSPGNNAASTITTTMNYTSDGSYSQSASIGQPLTVTDSLGKITHMRYDAQGNTIATKDALGNESDETYDIRNAPLQVVLPATGQTGNGHAGSITSYLYSEPSSLATTQWPVVTLQYGPAATTTQYDESGSAIRQVAEAYGGEGELLAVSGSTEPVRYTYDAQYRRSTLKDAAGNTTSYFYNPAGYLAQVVYPGAGTPTAPLTAGTKDTISFTSYDGKGNLLSRTDGNNVTTGYTYNDPESRLTDITYPSGNIGNVHFTYDTYGRRQSMTDGTGGQTYAYDDDDALTQKNVTWTGFSAKTISYGFYPDGSRQSMTADGHNFSYGYDGDGRMNRLTNDNNETTSYSYQDNGWLQTKTLADGVVTTFIRDAQGRLLDLANKNGSGTVLSDFSIPATGGYDGVGNRLSMTASMPGTYAPIVTNPPTPPIPYSGTTTYHYDYGQSANPMLNRSQLTQETSTRDGGFGNTLSYDGGTSTGPGNPTTSTETLGSNSYTTTSAFNSDNQDTAQTYDGNGNCTSLYSLTVDPENRVTHLTGGASQLTYTYSGDGRRTSRTIVANHSSTYFLYDGDYLVALYSRNVATSSITFGVDGLISSRSPSANATTFYTFDERGNVAQRLDSTAAVQSSDVCDAYRVLTGGGGGFSYGGQWGYWADFGGALPIFCTHRFYDPNSGRWLTRDSMGYAGGVNLYGYCGNNPTNSSDPLGYAQLVFVPTGIPGLPDHEYLKTQCGVSNGPEKTFGFWPNGAAPMGGYFGPGGDIQGGGGIYDGGTSTDDTHGGNGDGYPIQWNGNPAFGQKLCACIAASAASNPTWSMGSFFTPPGSNSYVCITWAHDMWDCATGPPPIVPPVNFSGGTPTGLGYGSYGGDPGPDPQQGYGGHM